MKREALLILLAVLVAVLAGCGQAGPAVDYVAPSDPVFGVCRQAVDSTGLPAVEAAVDAANNGDSANPGELVGLSSVELAAIRSDAVVVAGQVAVLRGQHPWFATDLVRASTALRIVGAGSAGTVSDGTASFTHAALAPVIAACAAFQPVPAGAPATALPRAVKPGPGVWSWPDFWLAVLLYLFSVPAASIVLARAERRRPRAERRLPAWILWLSFAWPVTVAAAVLGGWRQVIQRQALTPGEMQTDRIAQLLAENKELKEAAEADGGEPGLPRG